MSWIEAAIWIGAFVFFVMAFVTDWFTQWP